jgi:L-asparaginase/Glu-tRNA(Gln) amidotransferase subunit D
MLYFLPIPVVITGSQVPLYILASDGHRNLICAIGAVRQSRIPCEVMVWFHDKLMQGTRVVKVHSQDFNGFDTPNSGPIAYFNGSYSGMRHFVRTSSKSKVSRPGVIICTKMCEFLSSA